jgi:hypothetical protein
MGWSGPIAGVNVKVAIGKSRFSPVVRGPTRFGGQGHELAGKRRTNRKTRAGAPPLTRNGLAISRLTQETVSQLRVFVNLFSKQFSIKGWQTRQTPNAKIARSWLPMQVPKSQGNFRKSIPHPAILSKKFFIFAFFCGPPGNPGHPAIRGQKLG